MHLEIMKINEDGKLEQQNYLLRAEEAKTSKVST